MQRDFPARVEQLFHRILDTDPGARLALLESASSGDHALCDAVKSLLHAHDEAESAGAWNESALRIVAEGAELRTGEGTSIERYRLLDRVGAGGMAVVYKAVRADDEFSKLVAVKLILIPDDAAIDRFRQERQILAGLEHSNIVRLLDGGTAPDGSPFLVMEYVDGVAIDRYVTEQHLSIDATLELFAKICAAVSCAHRNLIIHRDLKPSNILVNTEGEPKVLDFGVAKLINATGERTRTGSGAMTPEYASPEQVRGGPITTATDIYSLGVLLYELLSGSRLYGNKANAMEIAQAITGDSLPSLLARSGKKLDTDLETVVLMALRKEPERRYATVEQFVEDIRRYRRGYPVLSCPDTRLYRIRRFASRNRAAIGAAGVLALTLAGGVAATAREARVANRRFEEVRRLAHYFVFDVHDAIKSLPGSTPARKMIVGKALEYLDNLSKEQGADQDLQRELASAYEQIASVQGGLRTVANLGDGAGAIASYTKAAAIREKLAAEHPRDRQELKELAQCYAAMGSTQAQSSGNLKAGVETLRKAVALAARASNAGAPDSAIDNILADAYLMLGDALGNSSYQNLGDAKGATQMYRLSLEIRERLAAANPGDVSKQMNLAMSENRLGMILQAQGDLTGSLVPLRRVLDIDEKALLADPDNAAYRANTASANRNLALILARTGKRAEAIPLAERAFALSEAVAKADPKNGAARASLASEYYALGNILGDDKKAVPLYNAALGIYQDLAREHPGEVPPVGWRTALKYRADAANRLGQTDVAIASAQELLRMAAALGRSGNAIARPDEARAFGILGDAYEIRAGRQASRSAAREKELKEAAAWFGKAADTYGVLKAAGTLPAREDVFLARAQKGLARVQVRQ